MRKIAYDLDIISSEGPESYPTEESPSVLSDAGSYEVFPSGEEDFTEPDYFGPFESMGDAIKKAERLSGGSK